MTTPKLSHQIPDPRNPNDPDGIGRMYSRQPDTEPLVPSITTLIGMKNERMEWWRGLCAGKEAVENAERIAQALSSVSDMERRSKEKQIVEWIDKTAVRDMKTAAKRGDVVHDYAETLCRHKIGENYDVVQARDEAARNMKAIDSKLDDDAVNGYLLSVERFLNDFDVKPVIPEATVWNHEVGYAGTTDLLCYINGKLTILDWKTKKKLKDPASHWYVPGIRETIAIQLEAAQHGEERYDEQTGEWVEWEGVDAEQQIGVALAPNGYEAIRVIRKPDTWETVKALKAVWSWSQTDNNHIETVPLSP